METVNKVDRPLLLRRLWFPYKMYDRSLTSPLLEETKAYCMMLLILERTSNVKQGKKWITWCYVKCVVYSIFREFNVCRTKYNLKQSSSDRLLDPRTVHKQ